MNHQARVRDRKRLTYQKFLRWVNDPANGVKEKEEVTKAELRADWLKKAQTAFPDFAKELAELQIEVRKKGLAREKFNGLIAQEITGLSGKELGCFMQDFQKNYIEGQLKMTRTDWALKHSPNQIKKAIKEWHKG